MKALGASPALPGIYIYGLVLFCKRVAGAKVREEFR